MEGGISVRMAESAAIARSVEGAGSVSMADDVKRAIRRICKECGGSSICQHGRRRSECKECGGAGICQHGRRRHQCKECGGSQNCQHGRRRSICIDCGNHRCSQCNRAFSSGQILKKHVDHKVCSKRRNRPQPDTTKRKRTTTENTAPLQGPKRLCKAEEARDKDDDDDTPPTPGVALVVDDDEATDSDSHHQPEQELAAQEPGPSRCALEEFIIFESCEPARH